MSTLPDSTRLAAVGRLVLRRLVVAIPILVIVAFVVFLLAAASPFDPVHQYYGVELFTASTEDIARVRAELGLDDPVLVQFWNWTSGVLTGDLGMSRSMRQPVAQVVAERLPWTMLLAVAGLAFAIVLALVLGTTAAWRQGG